MKKEQDRASFKAQCDRLNTIASERLDKINALEQKLASVKCKLPVRGDKLTIARDPSKACPGCTLAVGDVVTVAFQGGALDPEIKCEDGPNKWIEQAVFGVGVANGTGGWWYIPLTCFDL